MSKLSSVGGFLICIVAILFIVIHNFFAHYDRGWSEFDSDTGQNKISRDVSIFFRGNQAKCPWAILINSGINLSYVGFDNQ